jgi:hypothetical protein
MCSGTPRTIISFVENNWNGKRKLRVSHRVGDVTLNVGVTATNIRQRFLGGGVAAVDADFLVNRQLHLRIGLSRPFHARPDECYVQINGIYLID